MDYGTFRDVVVGSDQKSERESSSFLAITTNMATRDVPVEARIYSKIDIDVCKF